MSPNMYNMYSFLFARSDSIAWSENEITNYMNKKRKKNTVTLHTSSNEH